MTKREQFLKYMELVDNEHTRSWAINRLGVDLTEYSNVFHSMIECLMQIAFDEEQNNAINWWLYDAPKDNKVITFTDGTKLNVDTPAKLWKYIQGLK
jgi:hypothetical protein